MWFHTYFRAIHSLSLKNVIEILLGIPWNLSIASINKNISTVQQVNYLCNLRASDMKGQIDLIQVGEQVYSQDIKALALRVVNLFGLSGGVDVFSLWGSCVGIYMYMC